MAQDSSDPGFASRPEVLRSCQGCHGANGNSEATSTPRLNGQQSEYMIARLKGFSDATRNNPHSQLGMFKELPSQSKATEISVANYFAGGLATGSKPGIHAAEGKHIYENGLAAENVVACSLCHGPQGEGHDATPRIVGQHSDYLKAQLQLFNLKFRQHVLMNPNTNTMSGKTVDALTSYLANE